MRAALPPSRNPLDGWCSRRLRTALGFSLVETLIASAILAVALVSLAELLAISTKANAVAKNGSIAMTLAVQKMEQLRGLAWGYDAAGLPFSDLTSDTTLPLERPTGGTGLSPSPADSLRRNTDGYVDYLDVSGNQLGGGTAPLPGSLYVRRWSIEPLPTNANTTLLLEVLVTRVERGRADEGPMTQQPEDAWLFSVKTRKAR